MGPPAKKRKVNNDSKSSPASSRNLDFFFKKPKEPTLGPEFNDSKTNVDPSDQPMSSDEQLARKLQAEWAQEAKWDQEAMAREITPQVGDKIGSGVTRTEKRLAYGPSGIVEADHVDGLKAEETEGMNVDTVSSPVKTPVSPFALKGKNTLSLQSAGSAEDTISSNIPFDENPLTFDPSKYVAELKGHWAAEGGDASYALLTRCFVLVNSTQSRIKIVDTLVNLLRVIIEGDPTSLLPTVCTWPILLHFLRSCSYTW